MPATLNDMFDRQPNGFVVLGSNWKKSVELPIEDLELPALIMEVATRGVERFMGGEYETEDPDKTVGFGPVIIVKHLKTGRSWSLPSPDVLANAGEYQEAKDVQKMIDEQK